ncbi:hypothetical protein [Clostridium sp.]|uniref:hypothetical protein n=1 Tax=Clostridium sp. TaxID=1506 RepID=UPI003216DEA9
MYQEIKRRKTVCGNNHKLIKIKHNRNRMEKGLAFARKMKTVLGVSAFILLLGLAGSSDFESEYCYTLAGVATESNFIQLEDGTGWYFDEGDVSLIEGKEYKLTIDGKGTSDISDDTIRKIK